MSNLVNDQFLEDFEEAAEVEYGVTATVNGQPVKAIITGTDYESIAEQWHKLESQVNAEITSQAHDAMSDGPDYDADDGEKG